MDIVNIANSVDGVNIATAVDIADIVDVANIVYIIDIADIVDVANIVDIVDSGGCKYRTYCKYYGSYGLQI